jgi:hypothetical protein
MRWGIMNAEISSIDVVASDKKEDVKSIVKNVLYSALNEYCGGKIKYWNKEMDKVITKMWRDAYLNNFEGDYHKTVFDEVLALKQRQLDPKEYQ